MQLRAGLMMCFLGNKKAVTRWRFQRIDFRGFTLLELLVVIGIISILAVAILPAVNSLSKSNGRKGGINNLLGAIEQARTQAIKDNQATYVVFPTFTAPTTTTAKYNNRSYAVFEDDPANPATPKQLTNWKTLPIGVSIRNGSLTYLANSTQFAFIPAGSSPIAFPSLKFNSAGQIDPATTPTTTTGTILLGVYEGYFDGNIDHDTSSAKFTETVTVYRLTGRAEYTP